MDTKDLIAKARELAGKATPGPWEFRATEHSGGINFVVAPNAPRNANGTEFIPADCSHGFNGRFVAASRDLVPALADALEAAMRERDAEAANRHRVDAARVLACDMLDTAIAQVETLTETLRAASKAAGI